jgi:hypothetical protein
MRGFGKIKNVMKTKIFFLFLLISLLVWTKQVEADTGDTIHYYLPHDHVFLCVDTNNFPTFVIHKPNGFGDVVWNFNGQFNGTEDYFIFTPTNVGTYAVDALWGVNIHGMAIFLYGEAPPSPTFTVPYGGVINEAGDTAWMCGESISIIASMVSSAESTSIYWSGPNEFYYDYEALITVSTPGTYYFTRTNPCGTTVDSIEVVSLPNELPIIEDVLRCNEDWGDPLDPGPGYFSYLWTTQHGTIAEPTAQTLALSDDLIDEYGYGTIWLSVENACVSGELEIAIQRHNFPLPNLEEYSINVGYDLCGDEIVTLIPHPDASQVYTYCNWFKNEEFLGEGNAYTVTNMGYIEGSGVYTVEIIKGSCYATDEIYLSYKTNPLPPSLCVASFDPGTGINMVVFEGHNPFDDIEMYILSYEKTLGEFVPLDTIATTNQPFIVGTLYDHINDPSEQSVNYAVFAVDYCGSLSELGETHKTIMASTVPTTNGQYKLTIDEEYKVSNSGWTPEKYTIWIDSTSNGNLTQIGETNPGNTVYFITNPIPTASYYASAGLPWICGNAKSNNNVAFSNRTTVGPVGIEQYKNNINIFPNPSSGIFQIEGQISSVEVFDNLGRLILSSTNTNTIDLTDFGQGMYHAKIQTTENGPSAVVKLIVQ